MPFRGQMPIHIKHGVLHDPAISSGGGPVDKKVRGGRLRRVRSEFQLSFDGRVRRFWGEPRFERWVRFVRSEFELHFDGGVRRVRDEFRLGFNRRVRRFCGEPRFQWWIRFVRREFRLRCDGGVRGVRGKFYRRIRRFRRDVRFCVDGRFGRSGLRFDGKLRRFRTYVQLRFGRRLGSPCIDSRVRFRVGSGWLGASSAAALWILEAGSRMFL